MKAQIIKIGNSKGIRLPKAVLEQCEFRDEVIIQVKDKKLIVSKRKTARHGWAKEFERILKQEKQKRKKDELKDFRDFGTEWEKNEWEW